MKVTIAVPGKFPGAYNWARYLEERGELERLITTIPFGRGSRYGVSRRRTTALGAFAYWYHGFERYGPRRLRSLNQLAYAVSFDHVAALQLGDGDVFNGWSNIALASMREARRRGMTTILQSGSTHIAWQTSVLRSESALWKLDIPVTDPRLVARSVREYEEADAIVVPSAFARETFVREGVPAEKVHVVAWPTWPIVAAPEERPDRPTVRVLFVGTCSLRKGVPYLLRAAHRLPAQATVRLVGPPDAQVVAAAGSLAPSIEIVGRRSGAALASEYEQADVFVLPSIEDGSAHVVAEAMAAGLPVVVSDRAGADLVEDGTNGFVVPAGDVDRLADRLSALVVDHELREALGRRAAETATRRTWTEYGTDLRVVVHSTRYA